MSNIWKPRPPSFPSDDKIQFPFTAADINEFEDTADLDIKYDKQPSDDSLESDAMHKSKLYRARDSVFVRQKQRNSVISNANVSDNESMGSQSSRNVRFKGQTVIDGFDNDVFTGNEEVVLRRKTDNTLHESDGFEFDSDDNINE